MLKPSKLDPNYKAEMERKKREPDTFGMGIPLSDDKRNLSGSGLTADRDKDKAEEAPLELTEEASAKLIGFLEQPIADIVPQLEDMDDDQLESLRTAEEVGKARTGLLSAVNKIALERQDLRKKSPQSPPHKI